MKNPITLDLPFPHKFALLFTWVVYPQPHSHTPGPNPFIPVPLPVPFLRYFLSSFQSTSSFPRILVPHQPLSGPWIYIYIYIYLYIEDNKYYLNNIMEKVIPKCKAKFLQNFFFLQKFCKNFALHFGITFSIILFK